MRVSRPFAPGLFFLAALPAAFTQDHSAFINRYCLTCHNEKLRSGSLSLAALNYSQPGAGSETWEKVLRKLDSGQMPPAGLPRPDAAAQKDFTGWITSQVDSYAASHPNPGAPAIHRLNRAEYSNAVRDLLALDTHPGSPLAVDDSGYGFDNNGDVLSLSPSLLDRYITIARMVSRNAIGDTSIKPSIQEFQPRHDPPGHNRDQSAEQMGDDLPFGSRGGLAVSYYFPVDGEYVFTASVAGRSGLTFRFAVKAGLKTVGLAYPADHIRPEVESPAAGRGAAAGGGDVPMLPLDLRLEGISVNKWQVPARTAPPALSNLKIAGPYNTTGSGDTPARARIFTCHPATAAQEEPCARQILTSFAHRAFRRPASDADIRPLLTFYKTGRAEADFEHGIGKALEALLVSPDFLFRVESDSAGATPGTVHRVSDLELASRLSFFLWSSIPDDELLGLAEKNRLHESAVLDQQIKRMLADPRSDALISNFAGQWLQLRKLDTQTPDADAFPQFDESLRAAMRRETELFFASVLRENRPVTDLLDADYTYLNQRLAEHYGIRRLYGSQFRRVELTDPNRGGLLGQGSILTVTSYPNRTSVVQRGKWVLENLLGSPPPPPPPDVPELKPEGADGRQRTLREAMEQHRANPICAACHQRMDNIGFALENYNGVGAWRDTDAGSAIDNSGKLPDGTVFHGPGELKKVMATRFRDEFLTNVTDKLLTYALGRGTEYYDRPAIRSILRDSAKDDYRIVPLITAIIKSTPFQMRRVQAE
jgi:hypothetical protein